MTDKNSIRILGAILYKNFELLDLFGPLEMFGNNVPEIKIVTVAEKPGPSALHKALKQSLSMVSANALTWT